MYLHVFMKCIEKHENIDFTICFLMIYGENSTHLEFAGSSVLLLLQWVFNDFMYFHIFMTCIEKHANIHFTMCF